MPTEAFLAIAQDAQRARQRAEAIARRARDESTRGSEMVATLHETLGRVRPRRIAGEESLSAVAAGWVDAVGRFDADAAIALSHPEIRVQPLPLHGLKVVTGHLGIRALSERMSEFGRPIGSFGQAQRLAPDVFGIEGGLDNGQPVVGLCVLDDGTVRFGRFYFSSLKTIRDLGIDRDHIVRALSR